MLAYQAIASLKVRRDVLREKTQAQNHKVTCKLLTPLLSITSIFCLIDVLVIAGS